MKKYNYGKQLRDVWDFSSCQGPERIRGEDGRSAHPTQKPLAISRKLILSAMPKKGGVVLVPFIGTGSECVSAKQLGLYYVGFEINPDYVRMAEKFINSTKFTPKLL